VKAFLLTYPFIKDEEDEEQSTKPLRHCDSAPKHNCYHIMACMVHDTPSTESAAAFL